MTSSLSITYKMLSLSTRPAPCPKEHNTLSHGKPNSPHRGSTPPKPLAWPKPLAGQEPARSGGGNLNPKQPIPPHQHPGASTHSVAG